MTSLTQNRGPVDYRCILHRTLCERRQRNAAYSIRAFARDQPSVIRIRRATASDRTQLAAIHVASIRGLAHRHYTQVQIDAWCAGKSPDLYDVDANLILVALKDGESGDLLGFGELSETYNEVRRLYVLPDIAGQGVGAQLLLALEAAARDRGIVKMRLDASLNAIAFYQKQGYAEMGRGETLSESGVSSSYERMEKQLLKPERSPVIETPRLVLRNWLQSDRPAFAAMSADPEVMKFFPKAMNRSESDAVVDKLTSTIAADGFGFWAAEDKRSHEFIGFIGLMMTPWPARFTPCMEVGWRLARKFWGQGLASEGARGALHHSFEIIGRDEVVSFTAATNLKSIAVMQRLGMTHNPEDDFAHPRLAEDHPLSRHVLYRMSRQRWKDLGES